MLWGIYGTLRNTWQSHTNVQPLYVITMGLTHIIPNTRCYGERMELYEIRRNPIVKDNRAHLAEILLLLWVQYGS